MRTILLILLVVLSYEATAQFTADTLDLDPITVSATRIEADLSGQPVFINVVDSALIARALGFDLGYTLQQFSNIYIRNNGPGAASVISQRGLGGAQTRVIWEGMPLNHQMLGVTDLSLIQSTMISGVAVSGGSSSSSYGSGTGGSVVLNSDVENGVIEAGQMIGEFGNFITHGRAGMGAGRWDLGVSASVQENDNSFRYFDERTGTTEDRRRGSFSNDQVMIQGRYRGVNMSIKTSLWYSRSDHEIAENIYAGPGEGSQFDESLRFAGTVRLGNRNKQTEVNLQGALTTLDYINPLIGINSLSENREARIRLRQTFRFSERISLTGFGLIGYTETETNNYNRLRDRSWAAGVLKATLKPTERLSFFPALRIDTYSDFGSAVSPGIGVNYQLYDDLLSVRLSANRNFRAPTFNDLYWPDGGNEEVKAEYSMTYEAGLFHSFKGRFSVENQISLFLVNLDDGIRWLPEQDGRFRAQNVEKIRSEGVEFESKISTGIGAVVIQWDQMLSYTRAYFSEPRFSGDAAMGNQLPYVPFWQWKGSLGFQFKKASLFLNNRYNSLRYTTEDENPRLGANAFFVSDAGFNYDVVAGAATIQLGIRMNNIFNERYDIVRFYPMPLRNFMATIKIKYDI